ncbi:ankyrin repeat-containing domain protein, partial [Mycena epipterygia]
MPPTTTNSATSPAAHATQSKTEKITETASTTLEAAIKILDLLGDVTKDVPYLSIITGCIKELINIQKALSDNKKRANELLKNVGEVSRIVAQGLYDLDERKRTTAMVRLELDLERYQTVLRETCDILNDWLSKGLAKRVWKHGDFPGIADGIDRRIYAFRDAFTVARLITLSNGLDVLDVKIKAVVDQNTRDKLDKWLQPANVALSQRDAANKRHSNTGQWLLDRAEFREWIYAPNSLLWLHGISGSGKTILSSTIIETLRERAEPLAFFYFDTNNAGQRTVTQLLTSLVKQFSVQANPPDKTLNELWKSHTDGQQLPSNSALMSEALMPVLRAFTEPVYVVLDALDECAERDGLLDWITELVGADLPHLHVLLTSRPEVLHSTNLVQHAVEVPLGDCVSQDIESYITKTLSSFRVNWTDERKDEIKEVLLERSGGMFRLVALQLSELRKCDKRESQVKKALLNMPTSLEAVYDRILHNIHDPDMITMVGRAITWLIFAEYPMSIIELIDALAFDFEAELLRFDPDERMQQEALLDACAGFVVTVSEDTYGDTIKLAHASVKEYFLFAKGPRKFYGHRAFSDQIGHHLLAHTCIAYLCSFDRAVEYDDSLEQYPLASYAACSWTFHLRFCDEFHRTFDENAAKKIVEMPSGERNTDEPRPLIEVVLKLLRQDSVPYISMSRLWDGGEAISGDDASNGIESHILPPLYLSTVAGIGLVILELLNRGADVNEKCGEYGSALQVASMKGHTEIVSLLLQHGADVNAQGGEYRALNVASSLGHTEIVSLLLQHGADVNAESEDYYVSNALHEASSRGHTEIVRLLFQYGADVNLQGGLYGSALQAASDRGDIEISRLVLDRGADVNAQGGQHGNALQAASSEGHTKIVILLLEHGADVNAQGGRSLHAACARSHIELVRLLLDHGADVNTEDSEYWPAKDIYVDGQYGNPLQAACSGSNIELVRLLLERGADVNAAGTGNETALQAACLGGNIDIVRLLLEHGAAVNAQRGLNGNALEVTSLNGHVELVRLLIQQGADVKIQGGEHYGNVLQAGCSDGHIELVRLLLEHGADLNAQGGYHGNALQAACSGGHIELVRLLLEHGADVSAQGGYHGNSFLAAFQGGHMEIMSLLLEHGADVNAQGKNKDDKNALKVACGQGNIGLASLLLDHGADVNAQSGEFGTALQAASLGGHTKIVSLLFQHGADVNLQRGFYGSALQAASSEGHIELVRLLLEHGADVNAQGENDESALQTACDWENMASASLPFDYGADVNLQSGLNSNALQAAASQGHIEIVRLLIGQGANVNLQGGRYGDTLQAASSKGHIEIVHLLLNHGAELNGKFGNALQAASVEGHAEVVHLLLERGADVNTQGGAFENALQAASFGGEVDVVQLLLERGADVNTLGGKYGNALQAASFRVHPEIVHLLLDHGADVNVQGGNVLQAASFGREVDVVQLLLERGADVNAQGGKYGNPLQAASIEGHAKIVRLLLRHGADVNAQGGFYGNALQAAS